MRSASVLCLPFSGGKAKKSIVALFSALPFVISAIAILANAHHSKLTGNSMPVPLLQILKAKECATQIMDALPHADNSTGQSLQ